MDYKIPPRLVRSSMGFSIFTVTRPLPQYNFKTLLSPKKNPCGCHQATPHPCSVILQPRMANSLFSVFIDFPILDISHTWTHEVCGLFCDWPLSLSRLPRLTHVVACVDVGCIFICEAWHPNHRHTEQNPFAYKKAKD